jgi:hypothetical protein
MYGAILDANVLDIPNWEFGPMLSYRSADKTWTILSVNQLPP